MSKFTVFTTREFLAASFLTVREPTQRLTYLNFIETPQALRDIRHRVMYVQPAIAAASFQKIVRKNTHRIYEEYFAFLGTSFFVDDPDVSPLFMDTKLRLRIDRTVFACEVFTEAGKVDALKMFPQYIAGDWGLDFSQSN
jgi:hypothetical protein